LNDVRNLDYVAALNHGLERLQGVPLSCGYPGDNEVLLSKGGAATNSGRIPGKPKLDRGHRPGTAVFVPPPLSFSIA